MQSIGLEAIDTSVSLNNTWIELPIDRLDELSGESMTIDLK
jgi:hypothetical protein